MKTLFKVLSRKWSSFAITSDKQTLNRLKPFDSIPGPKPLPLIGNKWRYLPFIGQYKINEMDKNAEFNLNKFGKVVREVIDNDLTILHLFDPKDMESVFRQEGRYPLRRSHRALLKYRIDRPDRYRSGGLFPENGQQWYQMRKKFQFLLNPKCVSSYVKECQSITDDLIDLIRVKRDSNQEMSNFLNELYLWSLENTGVLALDSRLGCLDTDLTDESDAKLMIKAAHETNEAVMKTEMTDSWKTCETKDYQMLVRAQDCRNSIINKYLDLKKTQKNCPNKNSFLSQSLSNPSIDPRDLLAMIEDLFLAGIDTTAFSTGFALYHLSRNIGAQKRLRNEIDSTLKSKTESMENLSQMPYLKACVKETMRLTPVSIGVGRVSTNEMVINDYIVPKGTQIITQNQVTCRQSEYFQDPLSFIPERWLKHNNNSEAKSRNSFALLPFGYGPRMCIGRRFAEMEIYIFLIRVIQNFHIQYNYEDIGVKTRLINVPDKPLKFKFVDV